MKPEPDNDPQVERLACMIEERAGNVIPTGQYPYLKKAALECAWEEGFRDLEPYLEALADEKGVRLWRRLLPEVTIKESFLFRTPEQFEALRDEVLPELAAARQDQRLRLWSAGCAHGEEPATLALVLAESAAVVQAGWDVLATDVDERALETARRGEFGPRAVARVPPHLLHSYFERRGEVYALDPELQARIEYRTFNFFNSPYLSLGVPFDVVFLRNVLIYFTQESQRAVIARVLSQLAPDGYLFLGPSETLWKLSDEVESVDFGKCFAYRRPREGVPRGRRRRPTGSSRPVAPAPPPPPIASPPVASSPSAPPPSAPPPPAPVAEPSIREVLEDAARCLGQDRLDDAKALLEPRLESHRGEARVHTLWGLVLDIEGRTEDAVGAYRAALFLDPDLYQARFLRARCFEALGFTDLARGDYRRVLTDLGSSREMGLDLPRLLPGREEAARRCRRALERLASGSPV